MVVLDRYVPPEVSDSEDEESDEGVPGEGDLWGAIMGPSTTKYHKPEWINFNCDLRVMYLNKLLQFWLLSLSESIITPSVYKFKKRDQTIT